MYMYGSYTNQKVLLQELLIGLPTIKRESRSLSILDLHISTNYKKNFKNVKITKLKSIFGWGDFLLS